MPIKIQAGMRRIARRDRWSERQCTTIAFCRSSFCQIFFAALRASRTSDSCSPAVSGTASGRGMTIRSTPGGQLLARQPKCLADAAFPAVAKHGAADLARNGKPQPRMRQAVGIDEDQQAVVAGGQATLVGPLKLRAAGDAVGAEKPLVAHLTTARFAADCSGIDRRSDEWFPDPPRSNWRAARSAPRPTGRLAPFFGATPCPLIRSFLPLEVPGGTWSETVPLGVGTSTLAPATASPSVTGRRTRRSLPLRAKNGCGATWTVSIRSPAVPRPEAGSPLPRSRIFFPSSMPGGILTTIVSVSPDCRWRLNWTSPPLMAVPKGMVTSADGVAAAAFRTAAAARPAARRKCEKMSPSPPPPSPNRSPKNWPKSISSALNPPPGPAPQLGFCGLPAPWFRTNCRSGRTFPAFRGY